MNVEANKYLDRSDLNEVTRGAYLSSRSRRRSKSQIVRDSNSSLRSKALAGIGRWRRIGQGEHFNFAGITFTSWIGTSSGKGGPGIRS